MISLLKRLSMSLVATVAVATFWPACAVSAAPLIIRYGAPDWTLRDKVYWGVPGVARYKGWLQEEFAKDGIQLEFIGFKGGAPAVGQALANKQIDLAGQGDLLSIIGRSAGLKTRIIFPLDKLVNANLAVPLKSTIASVKDLRGKRVAYNKGNQIHLQVLRILAANGLAEKDIRSVYLDPSSAATALATGDVDAVFGSLELLPLRDSGVARIVYSTRGGPAGLTSYNALVVREEFLAQHPDLAQRFVNVLVRTAHWVSQPEHRDEAVKIWGMGPVRASTYFVEDFSDRPWADRISPLLDPLLIRHYKETQIQIGKLGLLRGPATDIEQWIEPRFLRQALRAQGLEDYWQPLPAGQAAQEEKLTPDRR